MPASGNKKLRGVVLAEDKRTERLFRKLLQTLGFKPRNFQFLTAPSGEGAAEAWVAKRYPNEVKVLRSKNYQKDLRLVAIRDADGRSPAGRKAEFDEELRRADMPARGRTEAIATPVPARNIETWLLALLGVTGLDETDDYKKKFETEYGAREKEELLRAAKAWETTEASSLPALLDGKSELLRISSRTTRSR